MPFAAVYLSVPGEAGFRRVATAGCEAELLPATVTGEAELAGLPDLLGVTGGYPLGADAVARLRRSGALTREQAERALAFCNNSGPAFLVGAAGVGGALFARLMAAHAEPQRHYHTQQHLGECLSAFDGACALAEHPAEVEIALWFHDAVYDVKGHDNEQCSADWARDALRDAGVDTGSAQRVHDLVMATRHTAVPSAQDERLLVDIDLSILGAERARFDEYEQQIRREYAYVPGFLFRRKRREILKGFLDRPAIYSTPHFHDRLEARARDNLRRVTEA